eukprot:TRINITY_DN10462_c0_g1_i1.p1 TRINITY_DN10462_c0_g1~~TRINITY_DN10462_c0_g1_i1.p1  ORF type:complete len:372 (+),score=41.66 TRINITY_DN10462_c0_g1_i1:71-1117(+)
MACRASFFTIQANKETKKSKHITKQKNEQRVDPKQISGRIFVKIKTGKSYKQLNNLVLEYNQNFKKEHVKLLTEKVTGIYNANRLKLHQAQEIMKGAFLGCAGDEDDLDDFQLALINYIQILLQQKRSAPSIIDLIWSVSQLGLMQDLKLENAKTISQLLNQSNFRKGLSFQQKCKLFNSYLFWKFVGEQIQVEDPDFLGFFLNGQLFADCQFTWIQSVAQSRVISNLQKEVFEIFKKSVKNEVELEKITDDGYWSVDMTSEFGDLKVAIEVEGRDHLSSVNLLKRRNFLRYQALKYMGWEVVVIPFTDWNRQITDVQKIEYIQKALMNVGVSSEDLNVSQQVEQQVS